ncbi:hypothetical protein [Chroococcidiopsis sp. SAG 2025]|nr:hypothetical protein [Chroococcidiopsis sp. SAG 2025]
MLQRLSSAIALVALCSYEMMHDRAENTRDQTPATRTGTAAA